MHWEGSERWWLTACPMVCKRILETRICGCCGAEHAGILKEVLDNRCICIGTLIALQSFKSPTACDSGEGIIWKGRWRKIGEVE